MKEIVFLLEELSAKVMLESLLPRLLTASITPRFITFEGKQDLEKQLVRRIRYFNNPSARFLVLRDQDSFTDCKRLKESLLNRVQESGKLDKSLVRIACHELETFYLGDLAAVEAALSLNGLANEQQRAKFRTPDSLANPSQELAKLTNGCYQKVAGSRAIGKELDINNTRSVSFSNLIGGIKKMEQELLGLP
jgi:pyoverdine/dityrosine biosynthesis protein Dit1